MVSKKRKSISKGSEESNKTVILFFVALLFVGLALYRDYGEPWDERASREDANQIYNYVFEGNPSLFTYPNRDHGAVLEVPLLLVEKALDLKDSRDIYLMRHLCSFLILYIGVYFFYLLCKHHFGSWKIGLLGSLFLVLSPRIFADSFYNTKDIGFLSICIVAIYTLVKYLEKRTLFRASLHALSCAIAIDTRITGILFPFLTLLFVGIDILGLKWIKGISKNTLKSLLLYLSLLVFFTILLWPLLWGDTLNNFNAVLESMSKFQAYQMSILYMGEYLRPDNIPWHYIPVWIIITTPLLYVFSFFVGIISSVRRLLEKPIQLSATKKETLLFILWLLIPWMTVVILKAVVYDGWRHLFFVYPVFLIISIKGVLSCFEFIKSKFEDETYKVLKGMLTLIVVLSVLITVKFMVQNHPHQNVYFNMLAGRNVRNNFELDYWGLSYRQGLEYILKNDENKEINVYGANLPNVFNSDIIKPQDRARLVYVNRLEDAKYFLSNYREHREEYPYGKEFYSIKVDGLKILVVYKLQ